MKKGFTLLEIMVAVAVVAILAALAVLSFSKHRSEAQKAVCASQRNSIAIASEHWLSKNFSGKKAPKLEDLVEEEGTGYFKEIPTCPCAGTYTITLDENTKAITVTCSYEEHGGEAEGDEGGGDKVGVNLFDGVGLNRTNGRWYVNGTYAHLDGNPNAYPYKTVEMTTPDGELESVFALEPNSEYELTLEVPASAWDLSQGQYLQTHIVVRSDDDEGNDTSSIFCGSTATKADSDPNITGDYVIKKFNEEDGSIKSIYGYCTGYNQGTGKEKGYTAESTMVTDGDVVRTTINFTTGEAGGKLGIGLYSMGSGWTNARNNAADTAISNATLTKVK